MPSINMRFHHKGVEVHVQAEPSDISRAVEDAKKAADLAVEETPATNKSTTKGSKKPCPACYKMVEAGLGHVCKKDPAVEALEGFLEARLGYCLTAR